MAMHPSNKTKLAGPARPKGLSAMRRYNARYAPARRTEQELINMQAPKRQK